MAAKPAEAVSSPTDTQESTKPAKMPVHMKEYKHVTIDIPLSTPSGTFKAARGADEEGDVFKTPMERRHITFDESDREDDEFVTPREAPLNHPLEEAMAAKSEQKQGDGQSEEDEDESDDDEAPEAISTHAAEAQTAQAAKAAADAAKK